jgi:hypothetical protein
MGFDELDVRIQAFDSRRDKSGKTGADRSHTQGAHAFKDLMLKGDLILMPFFRQRPVDTADVSHAHPGKMGRTDKIFGNFLVAQPQFFEHPGGDGFVGDESQWHIDTVQGHPVDFLFPPGPVPIGHGITVGDDIEIVVVFYRRNHFGFFAGEFRQDGEFESFARPTGNAGSLGFDVVVESFADGDTAAA